MSDSCLINNLSKILVAVDGSDFSEGAAREAISLAKQCGSQLIAVDVVETNPEYAAIAPELVEKEELQVRDNLQAIKNQAGAEGVDTATVSHEGENAWEYIVSEARDQKAEMIVMGRRGRRAISRMAMGSATARVIGHAPCDVLVVPREAKVGCENILVATDGSGFSGAAVREAISMVKKCGGKLSAISVASSEAEKPQAEDNLKKVNEQAAAAGISIETQAAVGKSYLKIIETAKQMNAGLIVIGCHGRTGLAKLLMGSVAERVIGLSPVAVLVACGEVA